MKSKAWERAAGRLLHDLLRLLAQPFETELHLVAGLQAMPGGVPVTMRLRTVNCEQLLDDVASRRHIFGGLGLQS
jgi:hypothetical protein